MPQVVRFLVKTAFSWSTAQEQKFGTNFWWGDPAAVGRPRSGFKGPFPLTGALTGRPPYGKAPYGEASYGKAPFELQESLREATGRDFTRIGREFPLVCRRPKKGRFFLGLGRF